MLFQTVKVLMKTIFILTYMFVVDSLFDGWLHGDMETENEVDVESEENKVRSYCVLRNQT